MKIWLVRQGTKLTDLCRESPDQAHAWEADFGRLPSSFGETFEELESRVGRFAGRPPESSRDLLVVAHRGSLAIPYALLAGCGIEAAWQVPFEPGSPMRLELACR